MNTSRIKPEDMTGPMWAGFREEMKGRSYGAEETLDAWVWYKAGWKAQWCDEDTIRSGECDR